MKTLVAVCVLVLTVLSVSAAADFVGIGSVVVPTKQNDQYRFERLRFGVDAPMAHGVNGHFLVDVANGSADAKIGNVSKNFGAVTASVGKFLAPPQFTFDSAPSIQLSDWPYSFRYLTGFGLGIRLDAKHGPYSLSLAHMNGNSDSRLAGIFSVSAGSGPMTIGYNKFAGISFYGEGHVGYGVYVRTMLNWWLNPSFGRTSYSENAKRGTSEGEQYLFAQNFIQLPYNLRLYGELDGTNRGNLNPRGLFGITWTYAPMSFVRLYYDTRDEELKPSVSFVYFIKGV